MQTLDHTLIDSLIKDEHARNYNPARFALLQHLHKKATSTEHSQNKLIVEKAHTSIVQYQSDLDKTRIKTKVTLDKIKSDFPDYSEQANTLFEHCKFAELERLTARLTVNIESYSKLVALIADSQTSDTADNTLGSARSIAGLILDQEQQARNQVGALPYASNDDLNDSFNNMGQLQSLISTRESMKHFNIDKLIERAIDSCPENAGPHNPHMLTITSLIKLRDLSPQYLRRFANYIETILWLEKNEAKLKRKI